MDPRRELFMIENSLKFLVTFSFDDGSQTTFHRNVEGAVCKWVKEVGVSGVIVDKEKGSFVYYPPCRIVKVEAVCDPDEYDDMRTRINAHMDSLRSPVIL